MKKLLLALLCIATIGSAQAQKGSFLVYGNGAVSHTSDDAAFVNSVNRTDWRINPGIGYQLSQHFTLGLQGSYHRSDYQWSLGPFVRYTQPLTKIFSFYGQIDLSYTSRDVSLTTYTNPSPGIVMPMSVADRTDGFRTAITPAIMMNVYKGWAFNLATGGLNFTTESARNYSNTSTDFNLTLGQQFVFGVSKNITCHCRKKHGHAEPGSEYRRMPKYEKYDDEDADDDAKPKRGHVREHKKDEE